VIASDKTLEQEFMHWQCLSRLFAARQAAGYPLDEAKPLVCYGAAGNTGVELTILILKHQLDHLIAQYKHNAIKVIDPIERFEWVVKQVSSDYYKKADTFQSTMTALCPSEAPYAQRLLAEGECRMVFRARGEGYLVPAKVVNLASDDLRAQFTQVHNFHFNHRQPQPNVILGFEPDWDKAYKISPEPTQD
jgi:hypothetical protein